jgi:hypothetical protein
MNDVESLLIECLKHGMGREDGVWEIDASTLKVSIDGKDFALSLHSSMPEMLEILVIEAGDAVRRKSYIESEIRKSKERIEYLEAKLSDA